MGKIDPQQIGRYIVERELGRGGMAVVYKAHDPHLERTVAIKLIQSGMFGEPAMEKMRARFIREAKALGKLDHPNIVDVHDFGMHDGAPFLVMDFIEGTTLAAYPTPMKVDDAVRLLRPVAEALAYVHSQGLLHRDVKPSNIMITPDERVILTDFGVVKNLEDESGKSALTGFGVGVGTPEYMSPEQGMGKAVDERSDMYSLAVVFFELITSRRPFRGGTPMEVILNQRHQPIPDPRQYVPNLSESVVSFLNRALAKNPGDRYATMDEFLRDFDGLGTETEVRFTEPIHPANRERSVSGADQPPPPFVRKPVGTISKPNPERLRTPPKARSKKPWLIALGLILLVGAGVFGVKFFQDHSHRSPNPLVRMTQGSASSAPTETLDMALAMTQIAGTVSAAQRQTIAAYQSAANAAPKATADPDQIQTQVAATIGAVFESTQLSATLHSLETAAALAGIDTAQTSNNPAPKTGDDFVFGRYEQNGKDTDGAEELHWKVLDVKDGYALMITVAAIEIRPFHGTSERTQWEDSSLRAWLNRDFFDYAFTDAEKSRIAQSAIMDEESFPAVKPEAITDRVFLLSQTEASQLFTIPSERRANGTDATAALNPAQGEDAVYWWLRPSSDFDLPGYAPIVLSSGEFLFYPQTSENIYVRPAIRLKPNP